MVTGAPSRYEFVEIRGLRHRVRHWGEAGALRIVLFHGWTGVAATFRFIADRLAARCHLVAPDWRCRDGSQRLGQAYKLLELDLDAMLAARYGDKLPFSLATAWGERRGASGRRTQ